MTARNRMPEARRSAGARALLWAAAVPVLLLLTLASLRRIWEADFWWQVKAGEIVARQGVPRIDTLSYASQGHPWIEMRWLYCDLLYRIVTLFGFPGAVVAKGLVILASFALAVAAGPWRRAPVAACAVLPIAILAATQRFYVRPELASFLCFALFTWIAQRYRREGGRLLFVLPVLQVLWSNLHTLFLLGPAIVGLLLVVEAARLPRGGAEARPEIRRRLGTIAVVLVATCAACLVTPYGTRGIAFGVSLLGELRDPVFRQVSSELAGPFTFGQHYTAVVYFEALLAICALSALASYRTLDPFRSLLLLSQLTLALTSIRNLPLFCLAAIPFVVANAAESSLLRRRSLASLLPAARSAALVLVVALCVFQSWRLVTDRFHVEQTDSNQFGVGLARHRFAEEATRFLTEHPVEGALFNSMFEGSYLVAHGFSVFIDPRLEVHGGERLAAYLALMSDDAAWKEALARYDFRVAVVDLQSPFLRFLTDPGRFALVHFDEVAAVFVRVGTKGAPPPLGPEQVSESITSLRLVLPSPRPLAARGILTRVESPTPYVRVADFLFRMRRGDLAEAFARDALAVYPRVSGAHVILGQVLEARADQEGALREFEADLAVEPGNAFARREAGLLHFLAGRSDVARGLLERSAEQVPGDAQTWAVLTKIHADAGRTVQAIACARKAVEAAPTHADYIKNLGRLAGEAGQLDEGIAMLERGLGLEPRDPGTYADLAEFLLRRGRRSDALAAIDRGLAAVPGDPELLRVRERIASGGTH